MTVAHQLMSLPARDPETELVNVIVETPRGCRNKYKYDEKAGQFRLHKMLPLGAVFPFDFGFVPSTRGEDGDPLDVLILMEEPTFTGCLVPVRLIGVLEAQQTEEGETFRNDRLIGLLQTPQNPPEFSSLSELPPRRLEQIEHFFVAYNEAEGRRFEPLRRQGPAAANKLLERGMQQYNEPARDTDHDT